MMAKYHIANGKRYTIVDGLKYMRELEECGVTVYTAKKKGRIVIVDPKGNTFTTYTSNGNIEAEETVQPGYFVVARADDEGNPVVDSFGHINMWQISAEKLTERYANVPYTIREGMSFEPVSKPQKFIQVVEDIAVMCPWGENGELIPQTIDKGGYLTSTSPTDCYGIAEAEFNETYEVI